MECFLKVLIDFLKVLNPSAGAGGGGGNRQNRTKQNRPPGNPVRVKFFLKNYRTVRMKNYEGKSCKSFSFLFLEFCFWNFQKMMRAF